jgi:uncharacterized membrane protein
LSNWAFMWTCTSSSTWLNFLSPIYTTCLVGLLVFAEYSAQQVCSTCYVVRAIPAKFVLHAGNVNFYTHNEELIRLSVGITI